MLINAWKKHIPKKTRPFFNLATSVSRLWGENQLISVTRAMAASYSGSITVCEAVIWDEAGETRADTGGGQLWEMIRIPKKRLTWHFVTNQHFEQRPGHPRSQTFEAVIWGKVCETRSDLSSNIKIVLRRTCFYKKQNSHILKHSNSQNLLMRTWGWWT